MHMGPDGSWTTPSFLDDNNSLEASKSAEELGRLTYGFTKYLSGAIVLKVGPLVGPSALKVFRPLHLVASVRST